MKSKVILKKTITPKLQEAIKFMPKKEIPKELYNETLRLGIANIYKTDGFNVEQFGVYGNYIVELFDSEYIDMDAPNVPAIINFLS